MYKWVIIMSKNFSFLKDEFEEIYNDCEKFEFYVIEYKNNEAVNYAGLLAETISRCFCRNKGFEDFVNDSQYNRLKKMRLNDLISDELLKKYGDIRHYYEDLQNEEDFEANDKIVKEIHHFIFDISKHLFEKCSANPQSQDITYYEIDYDPSISPVQGSHLIRKLNKLRKFKKESIVGSNGLDEFKSYLHVDRSIQDEIYKKISKANENEGPQLIMLCGSTGDGKSHLLSFLKDKHPNVVNEKNFKIIPDATESKVMKKNNIEYLDEVCLKNFRDGNENNEDKIILLINLGVLSNFKEYDKYKEQYTQLLGKIEKSGIFDNKNLNESFQEDYLSIVSFTDYNLFEFNDDFSKNDMVKSDYISKLFEKITAKNEENPFYEAYHKDKMNGINNPVIYNYELLSNPLVQKTIINLIIKVIIKYKIIPSTRDILNLIYGILVPSDIKEYDAKASPLKYLNQLLPNLIFTRPDFSDLFEKFYYQDPVRIRNEKIDEMIIKLYTNFNTGDIIDEYLDTNNFYFLFKEFKKITNIKQNEQDELITNTIIRLFYFFKKEKFDNDFLDLPYINYLKYLYYFNTNYYSKYKNLSKEVIGAVYNWKGIDKTHLFVDKFSEFDVCEEIEISPKNPKNEKKDICNRFKIDIQLNFKIPNGIDLPSLNLDYSMYEMITRINKGYRPNKNEQRNLLLFKEFINKTIDLGNSNKYLIYTNENQKYVFQYDDEEEEFSFKLIEEGV